MFVVSDSRFHRLAERAVIAPVLDHTPAAPRPWHIPIGDRSVAVNQLGTVPVERLLERVGRTGLDIVHQVRRAVHEITS